MKSNPTPNDQRSTVKNPTSILFAKDDLNRKKQAEDNAKKPKK